MKGKKVTVEPKGEGILLKGRPSKEEILARLSDHAARLESLNAKGSKLGELKHAYHEIEYEE